MTPEENISAIREAVKQLDAGAVALEVDVMTGARIVAWEAKGALARSSDHALPLPDHVDRWVHRNWKNYQAVLEKLRREADLAIVLQRALLARLTLAEAQEMIEAETTNGGTCANCKVLVAGTRSDRIVRGRCLPCYEYLGDRGVERPRDLWIKEDAS